MSKQLRARVGTWYLCEQPGRPAAGLVFARGVWLHCCAAQPHRAAVARTLTLTPASHLLTTPLPQSAAKRYKVTASGKVMVRRAGKQHLNEKMNRAKKNKLSKENAVFAGDVRVNVRGCLPYKRIRLAACRKANQDHI